MALLATPPGVLVALVEGASFCLSDPGGDLDAERPGARHGLFVADRRVLSRCTLRVNGEVPAPVDHVLDDPASATFVGRAAPTGSGEPGPIVVRHRTLGHGLRDDIDLRNAGDEPTYVEVEVEVGADMAFAPSVRAGAVDVGPVEPTPGGPGEILLVRGRGPSRVGCRVTSSKGVVTEGGTLRWEAIIPARSARSVSVSVWPIVDGAEVVPSQDEPAGATRSESSRRLARWQRAVPSVSSDHPPLVTAVARSARDLGALQVFDPEFPGRAVVAAGAPWRLALHGRDALLTAWMSLIVDPELALGVLETLARFQGTDVDPRTEEEPGRILHRLRVGSAGFGTGAHAIAYGSVDATPLFVMLLGELRRWGLAPEVVDRLLVHADRALEWITTFGDRDGDGYVEYQRATDRGQRHQGWKDSGSPVRFPGGEEAKGPLAVAEVQGYIHAAYVARAHFATEAGDEEVARRWRDRAKALKEAFNRDFWVDGAGWFALALDGDKQPVPSLASNVGHCLWTGIVDEDKAAEMVKRLLSDDLFSGWGVRTLAASMGGYDPLGLHTGAVWPHDNAACAAGLVRYGFVDEAHRIVLGQLDAAQADGGRPAVLCGFDREDVREPVRFPDDCVTRATSAAAPLLHLRSLLRFDPHVPQGKLWLSPVLPRAFGRLRVERIPLMGGKVSVTVERDRVEVDDLPPGVELVAEPRRPLASED
jgi:glycogen debranching enzyme